MQPRGDLLGDKRYVTVFLRLLRGNHGRLEHGEIVDLDGTSHGQFKDWRGLTGTLRRLLATRNHEPTVVPPTVEQPAKDWG